MDYVRLGASRLKVSRFGLGMMSYGDPSAQPWALPEERAEPIVRRAVHRGSGAVPGELGHFTAWYCKLLLSGDRPAAGTRWPR